MAHQLTFRLRLDALTKLNRAGLNKELKILSLASNAKLDH